MSAAQKHYVLSLSYLFLVSMLALTMGAEEQAKDAPHSILFGNGHGIDHVGIAVRDLETAKKTYRDVLGFTLFAGGKHPNGTRNSGPALESGYLELITPWYPTKTIGGVIA